MSLCYKRIILHVYTCLYECVHGGTLDTTCAFRSKGLYIFNDLADASYYFNFFATPLFGRYRFGKKIRSPLWQVPSWWRNRMLANAI